MRIIKIGIFAGILALTSSIGSAESDTTALDYETLNHTVAIELLRAGSHDPSGTNEYFFTGDIYSLVNTSDERNTEFSKRKKIHKELGTFAELKIESLKTWKAEEKGASLALAINGDDIRKLAAQSMQDFKVQESEVAIMVEVTMYEKAKKYFFFGEDTLIGKTEYFPISQTKFEKTSDTTLAIKDDKGTNVVIKVKYTPKNADEKNQASK